MSTTVVVPGGLEISSSDGTSAADMVASLTPPEADAAKTPRVTVEAGKPVKQPSDDPVSRAASELGKKGGKAAAAARAAEAKAAKKAAKPTEGTGGGGVAEGEDEQAGKAVAKGAATGDDEGDESDADAEAGNDKRGNPRHDPKARINVLAREKREARERAERAEARVQELERERQARAARPAAEGAHEDRRAAAADADPDPEPNEGDYETHAEWMSAHARWSVRDERRQLAAQDAHHARAHHQATAHVEAMETFRSRVHEAIEADPEIRDRILSIGKQLVPVEDLPEGAQPRQSNVMASLIIASEQTVPLLLHFESNPEDFQRIAALRTPADILRAMAKLEYRLEAATAGASSEALPEVSKAPPPVRPVTGAPRTAPPDLSGDIPFDRYVHLRRGKGGQARA